MSPLDTLHRLLSLFAHRRGSDLFLQVDQPVGLRIQGRLRRLPDPPPDREALLAMLLSLMDEPLRREFHEALEANFSYALGEHRFRVSAYWEKGRLPAAVIRRIETRVPTLTELNLPPLLRELAGLNSGLVVFAGPTGSGKSSSLAAMLNHRNRQQAGHIWSVEDPIEFIHTPERCYISQREIGIDTHSYEQALQNCLRQSPDVIMIGEVRSRAIMEQAIQFAGTGHLCLTTLHAHTAAQALERILNLVDPSRSHALRQDLSHNLAAIVAQKMVTTSHGTRRPVVEILQNTPFVESCIREGDFARIRAQMEGSDTELEGQSVSFDSALLALYEQGFIDREEALSQAVSRNNLRLRMELVARPAPEPATPQEPAPAPLWRPEWTDF